MGASRRHLQSRFDEENGICARRARAPFEIRGRIEMTIARRSYDHVR